MPHPAVIIVPAVLAAGLIGLRARALAKKSGALSGTTKLGGNITAVDVSNDAALRAAGVPPPQRNAVVTFKPPAQLAAELAAETARVTALTPAQLAATDKVLPPSNFDLTDETVLPPGTFKAGDILPTDRISVLVNASGLNLPGITSGSFLARVTQPCTDTTVTGIINDPRLPPDETERVFPLTAISGVAVVP